MAVKSQDRLVCRRVSARGLWLELLELHKVRRPASHESPVLRNEAAVLV